MGYLHLWKLLIIRDPKWFRIKGSVIHQSGLIHFNDSSDPHCDSWLLLRGCCMLCKFIYVLCIAMNCYLLRSTGMLVNMYMYIYIYIYRLYMVLYDRIWLYGPIWLYSFVHVYPCSQPGFSGWDSWLWIDVISGYAPKHMFAYLCVCHHVRGHAWNSTSTLVLAQKVFIHCF